MLGYEGFKRVHNCSMRASQRFLVVLCRGFRVPEPCKPYTLNPINPNPGKVWCVVSALGKL